VEGENGRVSWQILQSAGVADGPFFSRWCVPSISSIRPQKVCANSQLFSSLFGAAASMTTAIGTEFTRYFYFRYNLVSITDKEDVMNKEQVAGKVDQALGKVEQSLGETVGNQKLANKGVVEQAKGAAKETFGKAKDAAQQVHDSQQEKAAEKANQTRSKVSESIESAKNKAKDKIEEFKERHSA
jgi:uncharacterized protein YjbJ (UPF0337 family)